MSIQLVSDLMWQQLARINDESECHCMCGETFFSLAHYIGKKTRSVSQACCPSCGSQRMDYVLPKVERAVIPDLTFKPEQKRKRFRNIAGDL